MSVVVEYYHHLHRFPELSGQEKKTSAYIFNALKDMGYEPRQYACLGVTADLVTDPDLPWILLRADMDALPVVENSCVPMPSEHPGVMHACGHDSHVAMLLGAAEALSGKKLPCNVRFLFQPDEELTNGAESMIEAGAIPENLKACFAVHVWPGVPKGQLATRPGALMASSERLRLIVTGKSAHCGQQHLGADALRTAADIVLHLPEVKALAKDSRTVLFCGTLESGRAHNIVADSAELTGTLRTFSGEDRRAVIDGLDNAVKEITQKYGTTAQVIWECSTPALQNSGEYIEVLRTLQENFCPDVAASLTAEDFSRFQMEAPGVLLWLGTGDTPPLHTPAFFVPEEILPIGVDFWVKVASYPW